MGQITQGVSGPNRETLADIYKIFATGDEWSLDTRLESEVSIPKSLRSVVGTNPWQDAADNPRIGTNDNGTVSFSERLLTTNEFMIFESINPDDFIDDFSEFRSQGNLIDLELNSSISDAVMEILANSSANQEAFNIAQGDDTVLTSGTLVTGSKYKIVTFVAGDDFTNIGGTNVTGNVFTATGTTPTTWTNGSSVRLYDYGYIDGLTTLIDADANVIDVASVGAITTSNAVSILQSVKDAIPPEIAKNPGLKFIVSYGTYNTIQNANASTQQNDTVLGIGDKDLLWGKYKLEWKNSMPDDRIIVTITGTGMDSNLVRGVWFEADKENYIMYREQPGDKDWAIMLRARIGFNYRWGGHIVSYKA